MVSHTDIVNKFVRKQLESEYIYFQRQRFFWESFSTN